MQTYWGHSGPFLFVLDVCQSIFQGRHFQHPGRRHLAPYNLKESKMIYDFITLKTNPKKRSYDNLTLSFTLSGGLSFGKGVITQIFIYCGLYLRQWFWGVDWPQVNLKVDISHWGQFSMSCCWFVFLNTLFILSNAVELLLANCLWNRKNFSCKFMLSEDWIVKICPAINKFFFLVNIHFPRCMHL